MSMKKVLGLENESIAEEELAARIKEAEANHTSFEFTRKDGTKVKIDFPRIDPSHLNPLGD